MAKKKRKTPKKQKKNRPRRKKGAIETDARGPFVWEHFFVRGKQKRRKQRVTVIDGKIIEDLDEWLLANADDIFLHQEERWDLIERRRLEEEASESNSESPPPSPRAVSLKIHQLEMALNGRTAGSDETLSWAFLNLTSGDVVWAENWDEVENCRSDSNLLELPEDLSEERHYDTMRDFVASLPDGPVQQQLARASRGKGAFRRFRDIVVRGDDVALRRAWSWFETHRQREHLVEWLQAHHLEPQWDCDIFEAPPAPNKRPELIQAVLHFVQNARGLPGVQRIALLGSLTTDKAIPKDVDLLVEVEDEATLVALAGAKRQLSGQTMKTGDGCGADVFLCNPRSEYLGRLCSWKKCGPGIRMSCEAQHCGRRPYVQDDLQNLVLDPKLLAEPPLDLWPAWIERVELPEDVQTGLVGALR